jgi:hypothetical protein
MRKKKSKASKSVQIQGLPLGPNHYLGGRSGYEALEDRETVQFLSGLVP